MMVKKKKAIKVSYIKNGKDIMMPLTCNVMVHGEFFAIHHRINGWQKYDKTSWTVTHIPSGKAIIINQPHRKWCKGIVDSLLEIKGVDWSEKTLNIPNKIMKEIRETVERLDRHA